MCRDQVWNALHQAGFAKMVGTGPVRPVPGGTGPARYMNRSGSHPKPCLQIRENGKPAGFTGKPPGFFDSWEPVCGRFC
jgi:hypothetical protein